MNKQFIVFTLVSAFFVSVVTAVLHQTGLGISLSHIPRFISIGTCSLTTDATRTIW